MSSPFASYLKEQIKLSTKFYRELKKRDREPHYEEAEEGPEEKDHVEVRPTKTAKKPKAEPKKRKEVVGPCFQEGCKAPDQGPFKRVRHEGKLRPLCLPCWAHKKAEDKKKK